MYQVTWDNDTNGILLVDASDGLIRTEIRPVFYEELDLLGFDRYWTYPRVDQPLLWATGGRKYYYKGELVAEAEGGGLFSSPNLVIHRSGLVLSPVNVDSMVAKNNKMLEGLVQQSLQFICRTYKAKKDRVDAVAVAFSGGKDSIVALDLVQRVLEPDQFVVVFGDTTMEVSDTYKAVEIAKAHWAHLDSRFFVAKAAKDAKTTWKMMGPPSRIHRWCCVVHKSAPTLLLLRDLTGKPSVRALVFDGVRNEESFSRSTYQSITQGGKHEQQINASPIITWNAGEVFLYLFGRKLLFNRAYRYGAMRVGCAVCPMAAKWWDIISWKVYRDDMECFIEELRNYAASSGILSSEIDGYLEYGGWKRRAGGRYLPRGGNRVVEQIRGSDVIFTLRQPTENWQEWSKTLGKVTRTGDGQGFVERDGSFYKFHTKSVGDNVVIEVRNLADANRYVQSAFRSVATKSAYCTHCRGCEVECPTGALRISDRVRIDDTCTGCGSCLNLNGDACLTARSLQTSEGIMSMAGHSNKALHTYEHFGLRKEWLTEFLLSPKDWVSRNNLGTRHFDAMIWWLRHAELISGTKRSFSVTDLGMLLSDSRFDEKLIWAVVWTNIVRNSTTVRWYVTEVPWGSVMTKADMIEKIGESYSKSKSTRSNAITALYELLTKSPLGGELGFGQEIETEIPRQRGLYKKGWLEPNPSAILYSLYRYAEKTGRYELTAKEFYEPIDEGPYLLFGVCEETFKGILQGLSASGTKAIHVNIVRDLDNIFLDESLKSIEVLSLD